MNEVITFMSELDMTDKIIISAIAISLLIIAILITAILVKDKRKKRQEMFAARKEELEKIIVPEVETYVKKEVATPVKIEKPESEPSDVIAAMAARIEKSIDEPEIKIDPIETYENDQEEESIISYQELLAKKATTAEPKPVSTNLQNIIDELRPSKTENMTIFDLKEEQKKEEHPKPISNFKNEPFVSPVFGIQKGEISYPKAAPREAVKPEPIIEEPIVEEKVESLEKTLELEPIKEEIKRSDSFLDSLKELRKNLD